MNKLSEIEQIRADIRKLDFQIVHSLLLDHTGSLPPQPPLEGSTPSSPIVAQTFLSVAPDPPFSSLYRQLENSLPSLLPRGFPSDKTPQLLSLIWQRVSTGARVVEAKLRADPHLFATAVRHADKEAIMEAITFPEIEQQVISRASDLAAELQCQTQQEAVADLFRKLIIPVTKLFQIEWLLSPHP